MQSPGVRAIASDVGFARAIAEAFDSYGQRFSEITRRSPSRFAHRDWPGVLRDAQERLALYRRIVEETVASLDVAGAPSGDLEAWLRIRDAYAGLFGDRDDADLAQTFFNSVCRRFLHGEVGAATFRLDPGLGIGSEGDVAEPIFRTYPKHGATEDLIRAILRGHELPPGYEHLDRDVERVTERIHRYLREVLLAERFDAIHVVPTHFFRNKAAFLMGRLLVGAAVIPLVISFRNGEHGVVVHSVLIEEVAGGKLFSNTRSNFHVEVRRHRELVGFLRSLFPQKQLHELYGGIGYYNHARTQLYEGLVRHLRDSRERFEFAPGARGQVMIVFTLPSFPMVFKLIRDRFGPPKTVTRQDVIRKYQFVREADRAGRMLDALTYGDLKFHRDLFRSDLLKELLTSAPSTVGLLGDHVVIRHVYVQRQVTPLPEYLRRTKDLRKHRDAIIDFGYLIKDLAAVNIFLGDYLLKNFGVTSYRKVVSFDYDELGLFTQQVFRRWPRAQDDDEEWSGSHIESLVVQDCDVFPEEFERFLGIPDHLMPSFKHHHADLFTPEYYVRIQERLNAHEVIDISSSQVGSLLGEARPALP